MPKRAKELTARHVAYLKEDGCYAVGGVVGLYLNIKGASRSWLLRIKVGQRRREFGLGGYPRDHPRGGPRSHLGETPAAVGSVHQRPRDGGVIVSRRYRHLEDGQHEHQGGRPSSDDV